MYAKFTVVLVRIYVALFFLPIFIVDAIVKHHSTLYLWILFRYCFFHSILFGACFVSFMWIPCGALYCFWKQQKARNAFVSISTIYFKHHIISNRCTEHTSIYSLEPIDTRQHDKQKNPYVEIKQKEMKRNIEFCLYINVCWLGWYKCFNLRLDKWQNYTSSCYWISVAFYCHCHCFVYICSYYSNNFGKLSAI